MAIKKTFISIVLFLVVAFIFIGIVVSASPKKEPMFLQQTNFNAAYGEYSCFGADMDRNGEVNYDDYLIWEGGLGGGNCNESNGWCAPEYPNPVCGADGNMTCGGADIDRTGEVNYDDYLIWEGGFGRGDCSYGEIRYINTYHSPTPSNLIGTVSFYVSDNNAYLYIDAMSSDNEEFVLDLPLILISGTTYYGYGHYSYFGTEMGFITTNFAYSINPQGNVDITMSEGVGLNISNLKIV